MENSILDTVGYAEPDRYDLRPYQNELVTAARSGKNTIVCAPTGSGKTVVAVDIILDHLQKMAEAGKTARVRNKCSAALLMALLRGVGPLA